jgi:hypothetical protein
MDSRSEQELCCTSVDARVRRFVPMRDGRAIRASARLLGFRFHGTINGKAKGACWMAHEGLHESIDQLSPTTVDYHRAVISLMEELEAVDWYNQRIDAAADDELKQILAHNRDEEKEHAAMVLEWLRRQDATLGKWLSTYLFHEGSIVQREAETTGGTGGAAAGEAASDAPGDGSLGIGSLKGNGSRGRQRRG